MFLDVFSDNNVTIVTNDKGYIETYIYLYYIISVPLKSGQININQTIPEKGKN